MEGNVWLKYFYLTMFLNYQFLKYCFGIILKLKIIIFYQNVTYVTVDKLSKGGEFLIDFHEVKMLFLHKCEDHN